MNKKANLSLVILSVVAIAALGGIAIMYNGGATGAIAVDKSSRLCVGPQMIGPNHFGCDQLNPIPDGDQPNGWIPVPVLPPGATTTLDDLSTGEISICAGDLAWFAPSGSPGVWNRCFPQG